MPAILPAQTLIHGRVSDARSGEPLPFVNIFFKGTGIGTTTDFDGFYTLSTDSPLDSITAAYVGYTEVSKPIQKGKTQTINFLLSEAETALKEFVVKPGENPAIRIIKAAQQKREINNYERLQAYEYESFTKVQLAIDQLTEKDKKRKIFKDILPLFDTVSQLNDGTNTPVLPVFISETISDFYVTRNPFKQKEVIKASKIIGVGMEDGSVTAQLLGSTFQQYNFHINWVRILEKDFISPVGDAALAFYYYRLTDTVEIDGYRCFRIECTPQNSSFLAFTGTIWIADSAFAIKRLQFHMDQRANLNFIDQFKIQQEYEATSSGAWVPQKTRILLNLDEPSSTAPGVVALFYVSNKNIKVNEPHDPKFYEETLVLKEDALTKSDEYWNENRHEQVTEGDLKVMKMIDTLNNLPVVKTWVEWVNIIVSGYKRIGPIDIGPYAFVYGYNALEGHRFRIGFRTNYTLSEHFVFRAYVAYGTYDQRFKYSLQNEFFFDKKHWVVLGMKYRDDVDQIGVTDQNYDQSNLFTSLSLLQSSQLNRTKEGLAWLFRQHSRSWSQRLTFHSKAYLFEPIGNRFNFAFFEQRSPSYTIISSKFQTTTATLETKFSYRENFLLNRNERISLGPQKGPEVVFSYTRGFKELNGQFEFDKLNISVAQRIRMGRFGEGDYIFSAGKVFADSLPYPLLNVQRGNQSFVSNRSTYNLMNLFEFVCDQYVSMNYEHHFGGSVFNRIPGVKKWKLRFFVTRKSVWGSITKQNLAVLPPMDEQGQPVTQFFQLNREPYVEVGYGIENIFSFVRVDFIHRMTHLSNPGAYPFGVKVALQFSF